MEPSKSASRARAISYFRKKRPRFQVRNIPSYPGQVSLGRVIVHLESSRLIPANQSSINYQLGLNLLAGWKVAEAATGASRRAARCDMVQITEVHPDGTEELLPSMMAIDMSSDTAPPDKPSAKSQQQALMLRLLPPGSHERVCPTIDLKPMVPRPLLLQLRPSFPLAKVHAPLFAPRRWTVTSDTDECMDSADDDALSSSSHATADSTSTRLGEQYGDALAAGVPATAARRTGHRRKLRFGAGDVAMGSGAAGSGGSEAAAEVDRLASQFHDWPTDWEVSPPKRAKGCAAATDAAGGASVWPVTTGPGRGVGGGPRPDTAASEQPPAPPPTPRPGAAFSRPTERSHASFLGGGGASSVLSGDAVGRSKRKAVDDAPIIDEMAQLDLGLTADGSGGAAGLFARSRKKQARSPVPAREAGGAGGRHCTRSSASGMAEAPLSPQAAAPHPPLPTPAPSLPDASAASQAGAGKAEPPTPARPGWERAARPPVRVCHDAGEAGRSPSRPAITSLL